MPSPHTLTVTLFVLSTASFASQLPEIKLDRDNIVITRSVRLKPGRYVVADSDNNGVLQVRGRNVTVDFRGATLCASPSIGKDLEHAKGIGIAISSADGVTIRNARVHGFRYNIRAERTAGLRIERCDASYSGAQRVGRDGESIEIWLGLRDLNAWRAYGAGIWVEASERAVLKECRAVGAQNGILLVSTDNSRLVANDVSFNSGFGIGLWEACDNEVCWNMVDFVNRPWFAWGGDSAGIVVVGSSHRNLIVGNSMTHGGDGFFLTDRVNGGFDRRTNSFSFDGHCSDNLIALNDGSWSPHNAFEGTFSFRNVYYRNIANDSGYGFWLGYSCDSLLLENDIRDNFGEGIAIEQGSGNRIVGNTMVNNRGMAVHLWGATGNPAESKDADIVDNLIRNSRQAIVLQNTANALVKSNRLENAPIDENSRFVTDRPASDAVTVFRRSPRFERLQKILKTKPAGFKLYRDTTFPRGIKWLQPDDYAPRDFRRDVVAWRRESDTKFELMAVKPGELRFEHPAWVSVERSASDRRVYTATVKAPPDNVGQFTRLGLKITSRASGQSQRIDVPVLTTLWDVKWFDWSGNRIEWTDAEGWEKIWAGAHVIAQKLPQIERDYSFKTPAPGLPSEYFAFEATTRIRTGAGKHRLNLLSDDGIRVWIDGKLVVDAWGHAPGTRVAEIDLEKGVHDFKVRYAESWGHAYLYFTFKPVK